MNTFVLVHGGWFGGWCWQVVAQQLRANGHTVYTPTLTGLGERVHLASPQISLRTHAQDIANILIYEALRDVVLLGHSYSGMPLTLVPQLAGDRIGRMVYLDAFVPQHGDCLADLVDHNPRMQRRVQKQGFGWLNPPPPLARWHITDPDLIASIEPRLTPQPFTSHHERVDLTDAPTLPCTYISLTRNQKSHFIRTANRLRADPAWHCIEIDAGHLVMIEQPKRLVNCLEAIATL